MDYMESKLLTSMKRRLFDELQNSVEKHANYRNKIKVFHKFPYKERPMMGIVLKGMSATRMQLSSDDFSATMSSHLALAGAETKEGRILKWVNEDQINLTKYQKDEDLSYQLSGDTDIGTNRVFTVNHKPIVAGPFNTKMADNFAQVDVTVNGNKAFPEYVNGKKGVIILPEAPALGSTITVSYYYSNLTPPGRYYIEIVSPTQFVIDPLYAIKEEELVSKTTGTEISSQTENHNLIPNLDVLYTVKNRFANKIYLERGIDYSITSDGLITFLHPLPVGTALYANYRWIGSELGPFDLPDGNYEYNNTALPGVILAFSSERIVGDKNIVIVYPKRETAAKVYSGHWNMNVQIDVVSRDTQQLPEITDYIINDMWSYKRLELAMEGITMVSFDPTGESELEYDPNTGDQYYIHTLSLVLMVEWKRFVPYLTEIMDFDTHIYPFPQQSEYYINKEGKVFEKPVTFPLKPFEVTYPEAGRVRYY